MVLLPCSKCCGPCWRCYELDTCGENYFKVNESKRFLTFKYSSKFDDVENQYSGASFNVQTEQTVEFPSKIDGISIEINGLWFSVFAEIDQGQKTHAFSINGPFPVSGVAGQHRVRIEQGYCQSQSVFDIRGTTPGSVSDTTFFLEKFDENINGQPFYQLPTGFDSEIGSGSIWNLRHSCSDSSSSKPALEDSPPGPMSLHYLLNMRPFGVPENQYQLCPLEGLFEVSEFYSEEYGNLFVDLPSESLDKCGFL